MPKPFVVFCSHASADRTHDDDMHMHKFMKKFREALRAKTGGRDVTRLTFFDVESIPPGNVWNQDIADAVRTAATLTCLVTPAFVRSVWCGRELEVFLRRHGKRLQAPKAGGPKSGGPKADVEAGFVFPIIWEILRGRSLPKKLQEFQVLVPTAEAELPPHLKGRGLRALANQGHWRIIKKMIEKLTDAIADRLTDPQQLPVGDEIADFDDIPDALLDDPLPYDVVMAPALPQGDQWSVEQGGLSLAEVADEAARATRFMLHLRPPSAFTPEALQKLIDKKQILLVVAEQPPSAAVKPLLERIHQAGIANLILVVIDAAATTATAAELLSAWVAPFGPGSLGDAVAKQRGVCCAPAQLREEIEKLVSKVQMALPQDPVHVDDAAARQNAQDQAVSMRQPTLTPPAAENKG